MVRKLEPNEQGCNISIYLPVSLVEKYRKYGISRCEVCRKAMQDYLAAYELAAKSQ